MIVDDKAPLAPPPPDASTRIPDFHAVPSASGAPSVGGLPPRLPRPPKQPPIRPNLNRPFLLGGIVALAFAISTVGAPLRSAGWTIAFTTLSLAIVVTSARRRASIVTGLAATAFVPWLAIRMSPWLIGVNIIVGTLLLIASVSLPPSGSVQVPARHHLLRLGRAITRVPTGPGHLKAQASGSARLGQRLHRFGPSAVVGLCALAGGLALLASGDALLASFLDIGNAPQTVFLRLLAAAIGCALFCLLIGAIAPVGTPDTVSPGWAPGPLPALAGMVGLATAIAAYAAVQASAALLGADFVRRRTGLTYAEYARGGFFQLVVVSAVATLAVTVARSVVRRHPEATTRFRVASAALTVGVVTTVVASVVKLAVYADTFGLTMLRVYTVVFACWLGLVSVATFVALLRPSRDWLAPTLIATAVVGAFAMNVVNPERIVADHNIDRAATTGTLDADYLNTLSLDAAPTILSRLDEIDAELPDDEWLRRSDPVTTDARTVLRESWCGRTDTTAGTNWLAYNVSRDAADRERRSACR